MNNWHLPLSTKNLHSLDRLLPRSMMSTATSVPRRTVLSSLHPTRWTASRTMVPARRLSMVLTLRSKQLIWPRTKPWANLAQLCWLKQTAYRRTFYLWFDNQTPSISTSAVTTKQGANFLILISIQPGYPLANWWWSGKGSISVLYVPTNRNLICHHHLWPH